MGAECSTDRCSAPSVCQVQHEEDTTHFESLQEATQCEWCLRPFSYFQTKVNCCECGRVFCTRCTQYYKAVPKRGFYDPVRVCFLCFNKSPCNAQRDVADGRTRSQSSVGTPSVGFLVQPLRHTDSSRTLSTELHMKDAMEDIPAAKPHSVLGHAPLPPALLRDIKLLIVGETGARKRFCTESILGKSTWPFTTAAVLPVTTASSMVTFDVPFGRCRVTVTSVEGSDTEVRAYTTAVTCVLAVVDVQQPSSVAYLWHVLSVLREHERVLCKSAAQDRVNSSPASSTPCVCVAFGGISALRHRDTLRRDYHCELHLLQQGERSGRHQSFGPNEELLRTEVRGVFYRLLFHAWQREYGLGWHASLHSLLPRRERIRITLLWHCLQDRLGEHESRSPQEEAPHHTDPDHSSSRPWVIIPVRLSPSCVLEWVSLPYLDPNMLQLAFAQL